VTVVEIRVVGVGVNQRFVLVTVRVGRRAGRRILRAVLVAAAVVVVVNVDVGVDERVVVVCVPMAFGDMNPRSGAHQGCGDDE